MTEETEKQERRLKKLLTILYFCSGILFLLLMICVYFLFGSKKKIDISWEQLLFDLTPNLIASILGFLIALVIFRRIDKEIEQDELVEKLKKTIPPKIDVQQAPDLSKMEKLLEDMVGKWKHWTPEGVCSIDAVGCPSELKMIYKKYAVISKANQDCLKRTNQLLLTRLKYFSDQIGNIENGEWQLMLKDGDALTDADLTYKIISEEILQQESDIVIKASTIFPYIEWWLTSFGLKYLQGQRKFKVQRVFLFPDGVYTLIFNNLNLESSITFDEAKKMFERSYPTYGLRDKLIRTIFYIHYCLKIEVLILSPVMLNTNVPVEEKKLIKEWKDLDTVIIQKNSGNDLNNICSIQIEAFSDSAGRYLYANEGTVFFKNDDIETKLLRTYEIISRYAIKFAEILNKPEFAVFKDELKNTANVLGEGYNISENTFEKAYDLTEIQQNIRRLAYQ